jgi:RTX calcium-binding nonapeptide repeat (4 copies)
LTLGDETGLDSVSNDRSGSVDLYGSQAAINAALASGVIYTPNANFNGSDALSVTADDQGNTGTGGDQFDSKFYDITVAPRAAVYWAAAAGSWDTSGNWNPAQVPTASEIVFIGVDQNGDSVDSALVDATAAPIAAHSLYLSNGAELDATDLTLGGNLAVDNATLKSQNLDDLTIESVGGSATVSADNGGWSEITTASGSLVFGDIDGDFTVTALTSDPGSESDAYVDPGADLTIGNIGGDLTVAATGDVVTESSANLVAYYGYLSIGDIGGSVSVTADNNGYAEIYADYDVTIGTNNPGDTAIAGDLSVSADNGATSLLDPSGDLNIGAVGGSVTVSGDNDGLAEMFAAGALIIGTGNPADAAIGGDLSVTADNSGEAYLGYDGYWNYTPGDSVTIGAIGGSVNVAATSGGDAEIYTSNDLAIGDVTHDFSVSASDSGSYAYVTSDSGNVSIGAVGGDFSVLVANDGDAGIYASSDLTIGDIGGSFSNQGWIEADGALSMGTVGGDFTNAGTIQVGDEFSIGTVDGTFANSGTIDVGALAFQAAVDQVFENSGILTVNQDATISNSGVHVDIALDGGTATFGGGVQDAFTIDFSPTTDDTLVLGDAPAFQGTLAGFGLGDIIDLTGAGTVTVNEYVANGDHTGFLGLHSDTLGDFSLSFDGDYSQYNFVLSNDGNGTTQIFDHGPVISTVDQQVTDNGGTSTLSGLSISDAFIDSGTNDLMFSAVAGQGTLTPAGTTTGIGIVSDGSNGTLSGEGLLADINAMLADGVNYTPTDIEGQPPQTDHVEVTVTDANGAIDSVNFIFNVAGQGGATLTGTSGNDVIYATGDSDTLTGGAGSDMFVFRQFDQSQAHNDTITDFNVFQDSLNFDQAHFADIPTLLAATQDNVSGNAVITVDTHNTVTLTGVSTAMLLAHQTDIHIV